MEVVTTAITNAGTIVSSAWTIISANPAFMIPIGISLLGFGIMLVKHLARA